MATGGDSGVPMEKDTQCNRVDKVRQRIIIIGVHN